MRYFTGDRGAHLYSSAERGWGWARRITCASAAAYIAILPIAAHADDITYAYDSIGRLTSVSVAGATAYYDYDAAGNISGIRRQVAVSSTPTDALNSSALVSPE
ncbi:sugar-binding protein [Burkholderia sp. M6-3]